MSIWDIALSILTLLTGLGVGRLRRKPKPVNTCEACNHHRSFHAANGSSCVAPSGLDRYDRELICKCLRYAGPLSAEEMLRMAGES